MTAAFWSRFKLLLLSRAYGCRGSSGGRSAGLRIWVSPPAIARGTTLVLGRQDAIRLRRRHIEVTRTAGIDLHARPLRGGHDDRAQVLALRRGRLGADELLDHGLVVL